MYMLKIKETYKRAFQLLALKCCFILLYVKLFCFNDFFYTTLTYENKKPCLIFQYFYDLKNINLIF